MSGASGPAPDTAPDRLRLGVAGAGAVGGTTGAYLRRAGHEIVFVDGWRENVEAIRRQGLVMRSRDGEFRVTAEALHLDELPRLEDPLDVVFLAVKSYDSEPMIRAVAPYLAADGLVVSTQNGLNEDRIAAVVGTRRTVGCVVHMAAGMFEPGVATRYSRSDWLTYTIGELDGSRSRRLHRLAELLGAVGPVELTDRIGAALWAKLCINAMINGLTGVTGLTTPGLMLDPRGRAAMIRIGGEVVTVAEATGARVGPIEPTGATRPLQPAALRLAAAGEPAARAEVESVLTATAAARRAARENVSSLLQDVMKGRRTEIDHLNGEVARRGRAAGIATPANQLVVSLVERLERGELESAASNLDMFLTAAA